MSAYGNQIVRPSLESGKRIKNYVYNYNDIVGKGNFAKVYKGINTQTQQAVAIKVISLDALKSKHLQQLVFQEIRILQQMNHPNILRFYEALLSERNCYLVTELCNQGDLEEKIKKNKLSDGELTKLVIDVYHGLKYLREMGVCHRDIKTANIFFHNGQAKIADFGLAKFYKDRFHDLDIGSPLYMSPQGLLYNYYGQKTDMWAFGVVLYEVVHGSTPFASCKTEAQLKIAVAKPLPQFKFSKTMHPYLRQLINSLLEINEKKRPSIMELHNDPFIKMLLGNLNPIIPNSQQVQNNPQFANTHQLQSSPQQQNNPQYANSPQLQNSSQQIQNTPQVQNTPQQSNYQSNTPQQVISPQQIYQQNVNSTHQGINLSINNKNISSSITINPRSFQGIKIQDHTKVGISQQSAIQIGQMRAISMMKSNSLQVPKPPNNPLYKSLQMKSPQKRSPATSVQPPIPNNNINSRSIEINIPKPTGMSFGQSSFATYQFSQNGKPMVQSTSQLVYYPPLNEGSIKFTLPASHQLSSRQFSVKTIETRDTQEESKSLFGRDNNFYHRQI